MPAHETQLISAIAKAIHATDGLSHDTYYDSKSHYFFTTDLLVEGQHFDRSYFSPQDLGWKAAAVNLSDIAASGGQPMFLLFSIGLPLNLSNQETWVTDFYDGVYTLLKQLPGSINVVGGDLVGSPQGIIVNGTAIGERPQGHGIGRRDCAQPGDVIILSSSGAGSHHAGLSAIGLEALRQGWEGFDTAKEKHLRPFPQVALGLQYSACLGSKQAPCCLMDSSDGLADAVLKIAHASQVHIEIDGDSIGSTAHPDVTAGAAALGKDPLHVILYGGEDFELIGCCAPDHWLRLKDSSPSQWLAIGHVTEKADRTSAPSASVIYPTQLGAKIPLSFSQTYDHFSTSPYSR